MMIGITPFERPDAGLAAALCRAGALGVLDLGYDAAAAASALRNLSRDARRFGIRIPAGVAAPALPPGVTTVVLADGRDPAAWKPRTVLVQVTSLEEARAAVAAGADGLIAKGNESGGRVGDETAFVLLQRLADLGVPVWVQGGVGLHTAAACLAGGARGVVLDSQLALLDDCGLPRALKDALGALDGSETEIVDGARVLRRPGAFPAGQDVAFARPLAERFRSAARLVRGLEETAAGHLRQARALDPLGPGAPLAAGHGLRFPIAQGPMTRVSDRAAFAAAVADAGGLPFLALSLMRGDEVRRLLDETRVALAGRPWGAGILGFAPADLREEQLAAIRAARPPVALIAGGRPAQALPLEREGIATYLHVPSPGLLDLFWKDGARRFVLEGRECGGHVGPRSSFVLWESAIERLLAEPDVAAASVLFAGGIHDARSAAMVAAAAAPLAARGARIGVLLGTAYLFTDEAVASGAIQPGFQEAALACDRTALLETGPGHATRCAENDYVRAFRAERARLEAAGAEPRAMWEELEQLNLGRLRIAAKGLARDGERLVAVDDATQRREGMVMLGQVAALRRATVSIRALHEDVASSARVLAGVRPTARAAAPCDVAIVGMAGIFPGAPDLPAYWANVVAGKNAITEVPRERWNPDLYYDPAGAGDKTPSRWGGFLPDVVFDPAVYGIPPRSLAAIDPAQLLSLEVARRALADAGYEDRPFDRERASVIFGAEGGNDLSTAYGFRGLHAGMRGPLPQGLDDKLPRLTEDSFPGVLANVIAGRIANRLDLGGVNYTVDAACASSLAAVDLACKELACGTSDLVVCGGADLHNGIHDYLMFASVHALSPTGQCRPFDAAADGIALGEGVAALILKRLADAERDGDRIYAVIKAVAGSSDGKSLGLTAPRKEGQVRALERAYERAGVSPAEVELVEAHGTGTVVGDRTELATLNEIFGQAGALPGQVTLGSVKSQIGHTKCAAGLAGVIKAALAIHHRVLPPATNLTRPNPGWDARTSPFVFRDTAQPWTSAERKAGVSAFGFGGTNFHVVLSSVAGPAPETGATAWPCELIVVHAGDEARLLGLAESGARLADLAATAAAGHGAIRQAFVADCAADVAARLRSGAGAVTPVEGKIAILFPGQGSQRPNMVCDLLVAFPELHDVLRGPALARLLPGAAFTPEERAAQQAAITDTRVAQPALGMVELAVARLLARAGVRGDMLAGHSYGELVALAVAGALPIDELVALSAARADAILAAAAGAPGTMAAVSAAPEAVERVCGDLVTLANRNAPEQTVIAGSEEAVAQALDRLAAAGLAARKIPVACAFHSPIVAGGAERFAARLAETEVRAPSLPVYANSTAAPYGDDVRATLAGQIALPVRFSDEIEAMYAAGARIFVEAGPGGVLTDLVGRILRGRPYLAVACDRRGEPGLRSFLDALARLAAAGVPVDAAALLAGRGARVLTAPETIPPTAWLVNGGRARPITGELPEFGMRPILEPVAAAPPTDRESTVLEYLRGMREMVETQKQVMLRFLGTEAAPVVASASASVPAPAPAPALVPEAPRDPLALLTELVAARTGYPADMLDPDLDMEADLGIDSIKRIEILGALAEKLGLVAAADVREELAGLKTMKSIAVKLAGGSQPQPIAEPVPEAVPVAEPLTRYVFAPLIIPAPDSESDIRGRRFALTRDDRGVADELAALLVARGAHARVLAPGDELGTVDGLVHLAPLSAELGNGAARTLFGLAKEAVAAGAVCLVAATGHGGAFGHSSDSAERLPAGGIAGLLKSVAKENPGLRVRSVDLDGDEEPALLARTLLVELLADDTHIEVGWAGGARQTLQLIRAEPDPEDTVAQLDIGPESVVLLTGGTRGITARVAIALAERARCRLELVGRTPLPEPEDDEVAACPDALSLRRLLARRGERVPAVVEAQVTRVLSGRATLATLEAIERAGGRVCHHAVDVRDSAAFGAVIDRIYEERGRIDGVIHGAGVIDDKLLQHKTSDSFDRVFDTKVAGALTLAEKLRNDVRFLVFFSSISGAFGNRGQTDYAAANDALDKLALSLSRCMLGRIVSINWGPWGGGEGMISPELEREYARRGINLISPDEGVERLFDEISRGRHAQVLYMSGNGFQ